MSVCHSLGAYQGPAVFPLILSARTLVSLTFLASVITTCRWTDSFAEAKDLGNIKILHSDSNVGSALNPRAMAGYK